MHAIYDDNDAKEWAIRSHLILLVVDDDDAHSWTSDVGGMSSRLLFPSRLGSMLQLSAGITMQRTEYEQELYMCTHGVPVP